MIEFNLILNAAGKSTTAAGFWKLFPGTVTMLAFEYIGEESIVPAWAWQSFNYMRMIVTVGWAIYPAGYLFGYLLGAVDDTIPNVVYNVADFVNKIAFVLAF